MKKFTWLPFAAIISSIVWVSPVSAYIGPGVGLSAIGSVLALFAAIIVAIVGFLWFPIKRLLKKRNKESSSEHSVEVTEDEQDEKS